MAKDYKNRVQRKTKAKPKPGLSVWQWMLITALVILFVVFLVYLRVAGSGKEQSVAVKTTTVDQKKPVVADKKPQKAEVKPKEPHFEFYQILPGKEVVVPEYEIKTRTREERVGKAKESRYLIQAGSFKSQKEGEQQRAKLALMGIESKLEKAKVGETSWYRVKLGPFEKIASVNEIQARLKKNGVDVIVTEISAKKPTPATR